MTSATSEEKGETDPDLCVGLSDRSRVVRQTHKGVFLCNGAAGMLPQSALYTLVMPKTPPVASGCSLFGFSSGLHHPQNCVK